MGEMAHVLDGEHDRARPGARRLRQLEEERAGPHGRAVNVVITKAGERMLERAMAARREVLRLRIERLGRKEQRALADAVTALRTVVQD
jgi:DNA-binding MarR family transcriptional regulator